MRWIFFHGVFGDWGWEQLDDTGAAIAESRECFESRSEAEADATAHGYLKGSPSLPKVASVASAADGATRSKAHVALVQRDIARAGNPLTRGS